METIFLGGKDIYIGNLIIVNAAHPYHGEASDIRLSPAGEGIPADRAGYDCTGAVRLRPVRAEAPDILLEEHALSQLSRLMAEIDGWKEIVPVSGWRSLEEQRDIFVASLREDGEEFTRKFVALPGCSEHQTGLAIDLALKKEKVDFICPDFPCEGICQRFRERAAAYGFIERYREEKKHLTGIAGEPWHFRYVGCPHAEIMEKLGMCLEEYREFIKRFPYGERYYCWDEERREEVQKEEERGEKGQREEVRREKVQEKKECGKKQKEAWSRRRKEVRISYLRVNGEPVRLEVGEDDFCEISGDNGCGYIVTMIKNS